MKNNLRYLESASDEEGLTIGMLSGAITGIAAGGDVAAIRNIHASPIRILRVRLRFVTTTAFAAAQCMGFRGHKVYAFTAVHDTGTPTAIQAHYNFQGGHSVTRAGVAVAVGDRIPLTEISSVVAGTAAMTNGAYTAADADEPEILAIGAGSTLPSVYENWVPPGPPLVLSANTGLVIKNQILMGASGAGTLFVGVDAVRAG